MTAGLWVYSMRNNMITTIAEDYVRMGRAKGLSDRRVMFDYAARNAILPNLTGFAMQLGYVLGGAIVIEYLFSYPGLGYRSTRRQQITTFRSCRGCSCSTPRRS